MICDKVLIDWLIPKPIIEGKIFIWHSMEKFSYLSSYHIIIALNSRIEAFRLVLVNTIQ